MHDALRQKHLSEDIRFEPMFRWKGDEARAWFRLQCLRITDSVAEHYYSALKEGRLTDALMWRSSYRAAVGVVVEQRFELYAHLMDILNGDTATVKDVAESLEAEAKDSELEEKWWLPPEEPEEKKADDKKEKKSTERQLSLF